MSDGSGSRTVKDGAFGVRVGAGSGTTASGTASAVTSVGVAATGAVGSTRRPRNASASTSTAAIPPAAPMAAGTSSSRRPVDGTGWLAGAAPAGAVPPTAGWPSAADAARSSASLSAPTLSGGGSGASASTSKDPDSSSGSLDCTASLSSASTSSALGAASHRNVCGNPGRTLCCNFRRVVRFCVIRGVQSAAERRTFILFRNRRRSGHRRGHRHLRHVLGRILDPRVQQGRYLRPDRRRRWLRRSSHVLACTDGRVPGLGV